ncbi:hypothetical protein TNCV_4737901 [Trichonephila clavipes]|nr:hypothetical protein TNCV_4737901 [Trichonephila clavipes]
METSPVAPLRKRDQPRKVASTSTQNTHVPSPSTASRAISSRTIHPSTKATTTTANSSDSVSSPGRRRIHRGRFLGHQFLSPTDLGRADEEMASPGHYNCCPTSLSQGQLNFPNPQVGVGSGNEQGWDYHR